VPAGDRALAYADFPFTASLLGLIGILVFGKLGPEIPTLLLLGGLASTALVIIQPIELIVGTVLRRCLEGRTIRQRAVANSSPINIGPITSNVWNSAILSYLRSRITGLVYSSVIFLLLSLSLLTNQEKVLLFFGVQPIWASLGGALLLIPLVAFIFILYGDSRALMRNVTIADMYMLMIEGRIVKPSQFQGLENAIRANDWITARYYAVDIQTTNSLEIQPPI